MTWLHRLVADGRQNVASPTPLQSGVVVVTDVALVLVPVTVDAVVPVTEVAVLVTVAVVAVVTGVEVALVADASAGFAVTGLAGAVLPQKTLVSVILQYVLTVRKTFMHLAWSVPVPVGSLVYWPATMSFTTSPPGLPVHPFGNMTQHTAVVVALVALVTTVVIVAGVAVCAVAAVADGVVAVRVGFRVVVCVVRVVVVMVVTAMVVVAVVAAVVVLPQAGPFNPRAHTPGRDMRQRPHQ